MKITFVIKSLTLAGGGAERILVDLTTYLTENGHEASIISFDSASGNSFYPLDPRVRWQRLGIGNIAGKSSLGEIFRRLKNLRRIVASEKPDVAVGFMHSSYIPLAFALVSKGIPVMGSEHIVVEHYAKRRLEYLLLIASTFFVTKFTVLSSKIRQSYSWFFRRKAVVMPNPVSVPKGIQVSRIKGESVVLAVGKLEPQKDQITLIRAFGLIAHKYPNWNLRVVGTGSLRVLLEREVANLGLIERASIQQATSDIGAEYAAADIFVVPSKYESFGLVTAEAMAFGLPVVGFSDCPGTNEIIKDGINGILVNPTDRVKHLAKAISELIESEDMRKRLGSEGKRSLEPYHPAHIFSKWVDLFEVVRGRNRANR